MKDITKTSFTTADWDRTILENQHGQVWDTEQLLADFKVDYFAAPYVIVHRRSDNQKGTLEFIHHPRFYFSFVEDNYDSAGD